MAVSFRTKLLASHVGLVVAVGAVALVSLDRSLTGDLVGQLDQRLEQQARGAGDWAGEGGRRHPDKVATRVANIVHAEVTIFDREGAVLGASSEEGREDRGPEVSEAQVSGVGRATRTRNGAELHYVAVTSKDGLVLRLAAPLSEVKAPVDAMRQRLLFTSTLAAFLAVVLASLASRLASRPLGAMTTAAARLARGDFDVSLGEGPKDEFGVLWRALASLAEQLEARIGDLERERDRLSAILSGMVEGVLVLDEAQTIVEANPAAERILRTDGPAIGKRADDVLVDPALREIVERARAGEPPAAEVIEAREADGRSLAVYVRPLKGDVHEGGIVVVLHDLTHLRRLATMRRDFVANVSHELRTPVTSIQGYAETLLRGVEPDTARQFHEIIHRQAQRIGALVEQLLALSELEAREPDATPRVPVSVAAVVAHVAETVRGRADAAGARLDLDVPGDLDALGDEESLERALQNLVDNALKYAAGGGVVRVCARRVGAEVEIAVEDEGSGIAAEHLPRLFERFYRVDPGRARSAGGAGLGLSIVKHLVEGMGGTITVESELGAGTRFVLRLADASRAVTG